MKPCDNGSQDKPSAITEEAPRFLMCAPTHYDVTEEINVHMRPGIKEGRPDQHKAMDEWLTLVMTLIRAGASVDIIPQAPGLEDMVFTANAGLFIGNNEVVLARFAHNRRRGEEAHFSKYFTERGYNVLARHHDSAFEGQGDALWLGDDLIVSYGFRTELRAIDTLEMLIPNNIIRMKLVDPRWYHGDTCISPLSEKLVLWYPSAFDEVSQERLRVHAKFLGIELLPVTEREACAFVCNAIPVGKTIVVPTPPQGSDLLERLTQRGFTPVPVDMTNFLLSGGAARCLALNLNRIRS